MTTQEAINYFKNCNITMKYGTENYFKTEEVTSLAIKALEKQIPKKPKATYDWYILIQWECPECLGVIDSPTFMDYSVEKYPFCPYCGQKLDWSVVE